MSCFPLVDHPALGSALPVGDIFLSPSCVLKWSRGHRLFLCSELHLSCLVAGAALADEGHLCVHSPTARQALSCRSCLVTSLCICLCGRVLSILPALPHPASARAPGRLDGGQGSPVPAASGPPWSSVLPLKHTCSHVTILLKTLPWPPSSWPPSQTPSGLVLACFPASDLTSPPTRSAAALSFLPPHSFACALPALFPALECDFLEWLAGSMLSPQDLGQCLVHSRSSINTC